LPSRSTLPSTRTLTFKTVLAIPFMISRTVFVLQSRIGASRRIVCHPPVIDENGTGS
jgi:hypothetical protein